MKAQIYEDQLSMENMEIDLEGLDSALMPELSDSAELLMDWLPEKDKPY